MLRRVKAIPGVESAAITDALAARVEPHLGRAGQGCDLRTGASAVAFVRVVTDGYPAALGMPLVAGRDFSVQDTLTSEPVLLINDTMARTVFPAGSDRPVLLGGCAKERRIVGVVGDVRHLALEQASGNEMYLPMRQCRDQSSADLVVRSSSLPRRSPARCARPCRRMRRT